MEYIHVARDGRSLGRFAAQDVANGKASGNFRPDDLVWHDGLTAWMHLDALEGLPSPELPEPPPLPAMPAATAEASKNAPAWEYRAELGTLAALWQTLGEFFSNPPGTFERMRLHAPWRPAMWFYVVIGTVAYMAMMAYQAVRFHLNPKLLEEMVESFPLPIPPEAIQPEAFVSSLVLVPILIPLFLILKAFVMAGLYHAVLRMVGNPAGDFWTTLRVYCYALGTASVFLFLPMLGGLVEFVFSVMWLVTGLRRVHNVSLMPAMCAVLGPYLLLFAVMTMMA